MLLWWRSRGYEQLMLVTVREENDIVFRPDSFSFRSHHLCDMIFPSCVQQLLDSAPEM